MNNHLDFLMTALGLIPLAYILTELGLAVMNSIFDRYLTELDPLDDELTLARVSDLKREVWSRNDEPELSDSTIQQLSWSSLRLSDAGLAPASVSAANLRGSDRFVTPGEVFEKSAFGLKFDV
jgi:hypothetical protein